MSLDYSLTWNGKAIVPGATVQLPGTLVATLPWPDVYLSIDYATGGTLTPYNAQGVYTLPALTAGKHFVRLTKADGTDERGFLLTVVDAAGGGGTVAIPISDKRITYAVDATGQVWQHVPDGDWPYAVELATGGSLTGPTIATVPRADPTKPNPVAGINITGKGSTLKNVTLADKSGWGVKVDASFVTINNLAGQTFTDYLLYLENSNSVTVDGLTCYGGSTCESIFRSANSSGTVSNVHFEYTTATRKACMRGSFTGTINNAYCSGGIVGLNPLDSMDGGQSLLVWKFLTTSGTFVNAGDGLDAVTAANLQAACVAAVKAAIAKGETSQLKLGRIGATAGNVSVTDGDLAASANFRAQQLAERSNVTFNNVQCLAGLRWNAGTTYVYNGGVVAPDDAGNLFPSIGTQYPDADYVLPGDIVRPAPQITFVGTELRAPINVPASSIVRKNCTGPGAA